MPRCSRPEPAVPQRCRSRSNSGFRTSGPGSDRMSVWSSSAWRRRSSPPSASGDSTTRSVAHEPGAQRRIETLRIAVGGAGCRVRARYGNGRSRRTERRRQDDADADGRQPAPTVGRLCQVERRRRRTPRVAAAGGARLPQDFGVYPELSARTFLRYMAAMKQLPNDRASRRVDELLEMVNLTRDADRKLRTYSGGMKQRVGIAQALLNDPELLIVDEPTAGLDPEERVRFRTLLASLTEARLIIL